MSSGRTAFLLARGVRNYLLKRPLCISFEVTHSCNARCRHCHLGGRVEEERASPERLGEICREQRPVVAQLSGGEPLLRDDLEEIAKAFSNPGRAPCIDVTTNGVALTKERYISLREAGVDEFGISLDYPDHRHDEFRGVPGLFARIESFIQDVAGNGNGDLFLICVIQRDNLNDLVRMAELAADWNVKINFSTYTWLRTGDKDLMLSKEQLPEFRQITRQLLVLRRRNRNIFTSEYFFAKMHEFFEKGSIPHCRTGERFVNVNPDGTFAPCGLIQERYNSPEELRGNASTRNPCSFCYTSIRGNTEKPIRHLIRDNIDLLRNIL
jgi:MoaA/NifB/PqqE/SkfB family radical SAM enzyme